MKVTKQVYLELKNDYEVKNFSLARGLAKEFEITITKYAHKETGAQKIWVDGYYGEDSIIDDVYDTAEEAQKAIDKVVAKYQDS